MELSVGLSKLLPWIHEAQFAETQYFRVRRGLFHQLRDAITATGVNGAGQRVVLTSEEFIAIRGFLLSRNDQLSDDKRLAFEKTIVDIDRRAPRHALAPASSEVYEELPQ